VEVRSLNHRFLKLQVRIHPLLEGTEAEIENRVRARLARGAVSVSADVKLRDAAAPGLVDAETAAARLGRLKALWSALFPDAAAPEPARLFELVVRLPAPPGAGSDAGAPLRAAALEAVDEALAATEASREVEGAQTAGAILAHRAIVERTRAKLAAAAGAVTRAAQQRFVERVNQLLQEARPGLTLEPEVLLRESALYAERGDVSEELSRLAGHLARFEEVLRSPSEVGRRLEFLLQEMLREANTIGSKSLDLAISHDVVEMKAEIEKMKEQVQNLE
jgi:uncharacterized protein (TIGR00255 family)